MWPHLPDRRTMFRSAKGLLSKVFDLRGCGDDARAFALLRTCLSGVLLFKLLYELRDFGDLYGPYGLVPWWTNEISAPNHVPTLGWICSVVSSCAGPVRLETVAAGVLGIYAGALILLLLGHWQRIFAIVACITHFAILASNRFTLYGADAFASIGLFYIALGPTSPSRHFEKPLHSPPVGRYWTLLLITLLRLQLCVVYAQSGWAKASGKEWWSGDSLWKALRQPQFEGVFGTQWLGAFPALVKAIAICVIILEVAYPIVIWVRKIRVFALGSVLLLHAMIMLTLGLWAFGAALIVLNLAAFGIPALQDLRLLVADIACRRASLVPRLTVHNL
jgi:hypothetical protein